MAYPYKQIFAVDESMPERVAQNGVVTIFAPGDTTKTPLAITSLEGLRLPNPIQVNGEGYGPPFMHATLSQVAWAGGGLSGTFESYEGMRDEAVAARMAAESAVQNAQKPTDESVDRGIERADIPKQVAATVAANTTVAAAAAAAVDANPKILEIQSGLGKRPIRTDRQLPQVSDAATPYTHVWADSSGRVGFALRKNMAEGVLPGGLETPRAGARADANYAWAVADKDGRVSELAIGRDGLVPTSTLAAQAARLGNAPGANNAVRLAGVALTLPDSATPSTAYSDLTVRLPVKLGARASRWRVHVRNYNDKTGVAYAGSLGFTGVSVGTHQRDSSNASLTGRFEGAPVAVAGAFTTPENGAEWVSDWMADYPLEAHKDYLLSYGFVGTPGQQNYMASAGGWTSPSAGEVNTAAPTLTSVRSVPLDVWIEVEVPAATRVIAYLGDSLTLGIASTLPVYDSWAAKHAVANGSIHSVYAIGGSQFPDWMDVGSRKISKWADLPNPDAVMIALGNNDIFLGASLETMKSRLLAGIGMARTNFNQDVYLATVLPRLGANAGYEQVRKDFNEWMLTTLPGGTRMAFDFAAVIEASNGSDASLRWASAANNFHLSSAGYARCAATITQRLA